MPASGALQWVTTCQVSTGIAQGPWQDLAIAIVDSTGLQHSGDARGMRTGPSRRYCLSVGSPLSPRLQHMHIPGGSIHEHSQHVVNTPFQQRSFVPSCLRPEFSKYNQE